jgi:hypothetical protein
VKEFEGDFGPAQKLEIAITPDRVRKKLVEISHDELRWAKKPENLKGHEVLYLTEKGHVTKAEWDAMEASHAMPFIEGYVEGGFPNDRLIVLRDERVDEYPIDFRAYDPTVDLGAGISRYRDGRISRVPSDPGAPSGG